MKCFPTISSSAYPDRFKKAVLHEVTNPFTSMVIIPLGANSTMFLYFSSDSLNCSSARFRSVTSRVIIWTPTVFLPFFMRAAWTSPQRMSPFLWTHLNSTGRESLPRMKEPNIFKYEGMSLARIVGSLDICFPTISSAANPVRVKKAVLQEVTTPFKSIVAIPSGANSTMFLYFSSDSLNCSSDCFRSVISRTTACTPTILPSFFMMLV